MHLKTQSAIPAADMFGEKVSREGGEGSEGVEKGMLVISSPTSRSSREIAGIAVGGGR